MKANRRCITDAAGVSKGSSSLSGPLIGLQDAGQNRLSKGTRLELYLPVLGLVWVEGFMVRKLDAPRLH